ncbi:MAG: hypothetical protein CSA33_02475 [Desulfobulbus propionicus]|nr:MAG: hypothetical protein CSA33_02475 [Desulfobulbus propionicus]
MVCLLVLVLSFSFFALLPTCIGFSPVLEKIISRLSQQRSFNVQAQSCSLGWFSPLSCTAVHYEDARLHVFTEEVSLDRGMFKLLLAPKNPGTITLDSPALLLVQSPSEAEQTEADMERTGAGEVRAELEKSALQAKRKLFWEDVTAGLQIRKGSLLYRDQRGLEHAMVRELEVEARLYNGTVDYALSLGSPLGEGTADAVGFFNLPSGRGTLLDTLVSDTTVHVSHLDLNPLLQFAASVSAMPQGKGTLSGEWVVRTSGLDNLSIKGDALVDDLQLFGGILGEDRPELKTVRLSLDAHKQQGDQVQINTFALHSELLDFQGGGHISGTEGGMQLEGKVQLPQLFALFPHTVRAREGLHLDQGQVDFSLVYQLRDRHSRDLVFACSNQVLQGRVGSAPLYWDYPIMAEVHLFADQQTSSLQSILVETPFARLNGRGTVDDFAVQGQTDLAKAREQLGRLIELPENMQGMVHWESAVVKDEQDRYQLATTLQVQDLLILNMESPGSLSLQVDGFVDKKTFQGADSGQIDLDMQGWFGSLKLHTDTVSLQPVPAAQYRIHSSCNLTELLPLAAPFLPGDHPLTARGMMHLAASGKITTEMYTIDRALLDFQEFFLQYGPMTYEDKRVQIKVNLEEQKTAAHRQVRVRPLQQAGDIQAFLLAPNGGVSILPAERRLQLEHIDLDAGLLTLDDSSLDIRDWSQPLRYFNADVNAFFLAENCLEILQEKEVISADLAAGGAITAQVQVAGRGPKQEGRIRMDVKQARVQKGDRSFFSNQNGTVHTAFLYNREKKVLHLRELTVGSPLGQLQGEIRLDTDQTLSGEAFFTPDYGAVKAWVAARTGKTVSLKGTEPWRFSGVFTRPADGQGNQDLVRFGYHGTVDNLFYENLQLAKIQAALELGTKNGNLTVQGKLGEGFFRFQSELDCSEHVCVAATKSPQEVLTDVAVTKPLMGLLLARIHPLLGSIVQPEGSLSARLDRLQYSAGSPDSLAFRSTLETSDIRLPRNGLLAEILLATGLEEGELQFEESTVTCTGQNARVHCSPVRFLAADTELTVSGSVGYDGELDYTFLVPVTEKLVGEKAYDLLQGTILEVPVTGTVDEPRFDARQLQHNLGQLIEQAAEQRLRDQKEDQGFWGRLFSR